MISNWDKAAAALAELRDSDKPLTFHECGKVPRVEKFESDGCLWSWFMIWHTDYCADELCDQIRDTAQDSLTVVG